MDLPMNAEYVSDENNVPSMQHKILLISFCMLLIDAVSRKQKPKYIRNKERAKQQLETRVIVFVLLIFCGLSFDVRLFLLQNICLVLEFFSVHEQDSPFSLSFSLSLPSPFSLSFSFTRSFSHTLSFFCLRDANERQISRRFIKTKTEIMELKMQNSKINPFCILNLRNGHCIEVFDVRVDHHLHVLPMSLVIVCLHLLRNRYDK